MLSIKYCRWLLSPHDTNAEFHVNSSPKTPAFASVPTPSRRRFCRMAGGIKLVENLQGRLGSHEMTIRLGVHAVDLADVLRVYILNHLGGHPAVAEAEGERPPSAIVPSACEDREPLSFVIYGVDPWPHFALAVVRRWVSNLHRRPTCLTPRGRGMFWRCVCTHGRLALETCQGLPTFSWQLRCRIRRGFVLSQTCAAGSMCVGTSP